MTGRMLTIFMIVVLGVATLGPKGVEASSAQFNPPKQYYLALGDSLAFGYQQAKFVQLAQHPPVDPAAFSTGYVDDFTQMLRMIQPTIQTVNYGCPGETTTRFLSSAGCPTYPFALHNGYTTSQMDAALAFLRTHPGQVSPITLDIGSDDVIGLLEGCATQSNPQSCIDSVLPGALNQVATNLNSILSELRAASPSSEIIVMEYYNPLAVTPLADASNAVAVQLNNVIADDAQAHDARVADTFTPFNLASPQPQTLCALTLMCSDSDIHASNAGYQVIAQQFWAASGYARLSN